MLFKSFIFFLLIVSSGFSEEPWGKDCDLKMVYPQKRKKEKKASFGSKIANQVIVFHQKFLSPTSGPRSNFRPTSSRYMQLAIQRYGFIKGYVMGCDRLLRENDDPWVYPKVADLGRSFKFDPAFESKSQLR